MGRAARAAPGRGAGREGDRPVGADRPAGLHRHPHPPVAAGRPDVGILRPAAALRVHPLSRHPRCPQRASRAGARLHGTARSRERGRDVRGRGYQARSERRPDSGAPHLRRHARHGSDRDVPDRLEQLGARTAARRPAGGWRGRRPARRARAGRPRRRLDQVLRRPPLLLRPRPRQRAAQLGELHRRRGPRDRGRGAPPGAPGRRARHRRGRHRRRAASGSELDRARPRPHRLADRRARRARRLLGADRHGLALCRGPARRTLGRDGGAPARSRGPSRRE